MKFHQSDKDVPWIHLSFCLVYQPILLVRFSHDLEGIRKFDKKITVRAFVDDITLFLYCNQRSLRCQCWIYLSMDKDKDEQIENKSPGTLETPIAVANTMA